ncbi:MAG: nucleotidyltransferase domain-containing protein [Chlamydiae bacterium]|nr:nucleotidyltransferase domain-containing protein [Chlamydiota bacterium]MBI3276128.1 nucleotidyltransferase domain-containing protein [Chlamydiota bacterium]
MFTAPLKKELTKELVSCLSSDKEIQRIVIFGSFLKSENPHDMDVAIFQSSNKSYLQLALKYRKQIRPVLLKIAVDIIPVRPHVQNDFFLSEINRGEIVYER